MLNCTLNILLGQLLIFSTNFLHFFTFKYFELTLIPLINLSIMVLGFINQIIRFTLMLEKKSFFHYCNDEFDLLNLIFCFFLFFFFIFFIFFLFFLFFFYFFFIFYSVVRWLLNNFISYELKKKLYLLLT